MNYTSEAPVGRYSKKKTLRSAPPHIAKRGGQRRSKVFFAAFFRLRLTKGTKSHIYRPQWALFKEKTYHFQKSQIWYLRDGL